MWRLNDLTFSTAREIKSFVESEQFQSFADNLSPFVIEITAGEGEASVCGKLNDRSTPWWDSDKLSDADWLTTYTTQHGQQDRDPLPVQAELLSELHEIQTIINRRLNG